MDADGLRALGAEEWDRLGREAVCENPFYARQYVLGGLDTIDRSAALQAVVIRTETGRLAGLFPFRARWQVALGAGNLYQFSGAPLVRREGACAVVSAWLEGIRAGSLPVWSLPHMPVGSELAGLIAQQASLAGLETIVVNRYDRPRLTGASGSFEEHLKAAVAKSRRKDIERAIRRLRELGTLTYRRETDPEAVRTLLATFLALEQEGWKGAARTAFLSRPDHAEFAQAAFGGTPGREGLASIDALCLDGKPIALSLNLGSGETLFTPKCTYDESLRKMSPGIVLEYHVIEEFFSQRRFAAMDAATTVDGHLIHGLWNETSPMGTLIVGRPKAARLVAAVTAGREQLKQRAKRALRMVRDRAPGGPSPPARLGKPQP